MTSWNFQTLITILPLFKFTLATEKKKEVANTLAPNKERKHSVNVFLVLRKAQMERPASNFTFVRSTITGVSSCVTGGEYKLIVRVMLVMN